MRIPSKLTYDYLDLASVNQLLKYDRQTGDLTWRVTRSRTARAGNLAGMVTAHSTNAKGIKNPQYVMVTLFGRKVAAHRLVWFMAHNGVWPEERLRCVDGDTENLRLSNWIPMSDWVHKDVKHSRARELYEKNRREFEEHGPRGDFIKATKADLERRAAIRAEEKRKAAEHQAGPALLARTRRTRRG